MQGLAAGYYKFAVHITRLAYLNLLWVVFTLLGVIIFGFMPATAAMFSVTRKWVMGEPETPIFKTFWKTYREEFFKLNVYGIILMGSVYLLIIEFNILFHQPSVVYKLASFGIVAIFILYAIVLTYFFPIYVHFNLSKATDYVKWPFVIGVVHPILTFILIVGISVLLYAIWFVIPGLLFFFAGSVVAYIITFGAAATFDKYEVKEAKDDVENASSELDDVK